MLLCCKEVWVKKRLVMSYKSYIFWIVFSFVMFIMCEYFLFCIAPPLHPENIDKLPKIDFSEMMEEREEVFEDMRILVINVRDVATIFILSEFRYETDTVEKFIEKFRQYVDIVSKEKITDFGLLSFRVDDFFNFNFTEIPVNESSFLGKMVSLYIDVSEDYEFLKWGGSVKSSENFLDLVVDSCSYITAHLKHKNKGEIQKIHVVVPNNTYKIFSDNDIRRIKIFSIQQGNILKFKKADLKNLENLPLGGYICEISYANKKKKKEYLVIIK